MNKQTKKPAMSVLTLVMINVIAIDSLRGIPMAAHYGFSLIFYYILGALFFFIPSALVSAELATAWPKTGGIYIWVREAFGKPWALLVVWIQWIYNICWYPTILSLLSATLAYLICPSLANNTFYMLGTILFTYWIITFITLRGMHISGAVSTLTAIFGTLLPMVFIIILGIIWLVHGKPIHIAINLKSFFPKELKPANLVLLTGMIYSLVGMELSATHAQDVKNPQRDYPRSLFYSTIIIILTLILSSLAVAIVIPAAKLSLLTGMLDAYRLFFAAYRMSWIMPLLAVLIIIGGFGGISAWVAGPSRALLIAAEDKSIPKFLQKTNKHDMPLAVLILQGVLFTLICTVFLIMPTINSSFWILSDLTAQLAMSCYIFIFAAAIRLRYKHPQIHRAYKVPLGNFGIWAISLSGIAVSLFTVFIGFVPPAQVNTGNLVFYETFLAVGFIIFYAVPFVMYWLTNKGCK